jgi:hypothetical protein
MIQAILLNLVLLTSAFQQTDEKRDEAIKVPTIYQAEQGGLPKRGYRVITAAKDYEAFEKLMKSKGAKLPEAKDIDFAKQRVIVADFGKAENCSAIFPKALFRTKDGKLHIRYEFRMFQTFRIGDAPIPTYHPWSAIVAPINEGGYVIETDRQRIKGEPELWKADAELKP